MNGQELLAAIRDYLSRFVCYPNEHSVIAHVLWVVHAHLMDVWESTPRLAFLSPEPGSGKTRALEVTETLVPNPVESVNATPAYLFRKVSDPEGLPTILFDEIDTVFGPKANNNEDVRGLLNAGHRQGAFAGRCVVKGKVIETEELPAYCAVAMAGLGDLPDTILTRSVIVRMRRRSPNEVVEPYRRRIHASIGNGYRVLLSDWAESVHDQLQDYIPDMPPGVEDRAADVWEPLIAIADIVGGEWPEWARVSAVTHVTRSLGGAESLGLRLLKDLQSIFLIDEQLATETIIEQLHNMEEAPWGELYGKGLNARGLAGLLGKYEIKSKTVRIGDKTHKGYTRADLWDVWQRYAPPPAPPENSVTSVTSETKFPRRH